MYKLNFKKRTWIVKQYLKGTHSSKIALSQSVTPRFSGIKDFIKHYNEKRLHMSLAYKTPKEVWDELVS